MEKKEGRRKKLYSRTLLVAVFRNKHCDQKEEEEEVAKCTLNV
jgi:hypothetical protein